MTQSSPEDERELAPEDKDAERSAGPSGFGDSETATGGADAVPETPDNVPADGAE